MSDAGITAAVSAATGAAVFTQTQAVSVPMPISAALTLIGMTAAALVTWGMFRKATERHETEIDLLRAALDDIHNTLAEVRERVSRIEGKLENTHNRS